jgi:hypothetical protein
VIFTRERWNRHIRDIFIKASRSVCTSNIVVYPDPLSPTPSTSSAVNTPEITEEDPVVTLNQQRKGISKYNTPLISCAAKV